MNFKMTFKYKSLTLHLVSCLSVVLFIPGWVGWSVPAMQHPWLPPHQLVAPHPHCQLELGSGERRGEQGGQEHVVNLKQY